ncbi:MAG: hypothetical protein E5W70_18595 [Mesorhizobium sp.]|uniref:hypothetical protein n=1 Tax=Mesorhizobium sp. TaxID=1871066 RepID=UPI0012151870|nr:hypothetical protein [Mesorhizobium sp.]TIT21047.1 MAG: hypothetical protein E5W70_18595 [Mesorhizobium sp.]TIX69209.1 MAG: hypothetical protein E5V30_18370 [Mesorhizobium sp.]
MAIAVLQFAIWRPEDLPAPLFAVAMGDTRRRQHGEAALSVGNPHDGTACSTLTGRRKDGRGVHQREVKGLERLKKELPPNQLVCLHESRSGYGLGKSHEVEVITVADHRIFFIDIKDWGMDFLHLLLAGLYGVPHARRSPHTIWILTLMLQLIELIDYPVHNSLCIR